MTDKENNFDPIPPSEYPTLQPFAGPPPVLPSAWECFALLHPFSPLQSNSTPADRNSPFFELCIAYINYQEGYFLSAQITGISGRTWWYITEANGTYLSRGTWSQPPPPPSLSDRVNIGWTLPDTNWFGNQLQNASCAGTSYLNWMQAQEVNWWKMPVPGTNPPAATWMWFDANSNLPVRLMFGQGPPSPSMGDPNQLALFQMFSFTYFPMFNDLSGATSISSSWVYPPIEGFSFRNQFNYRLFTWNPNFGMTAFMTPVNEKFNPLPTRVLYVWKPDGEYRVASDRAQSTRMMYNYNRQNPFTSQVALLTGAPPSGVRPPPNSGRGFLINYRGDQVTGCVSGRNFPFPEEPPYWVSIPEEQGTIQATIKSNPVLCPGETVTILSVLFPPSPPNYPDSTYLWTWYSPLSPDGTSSRPVTFMQSQSGVGVGTSLALADYFYYQQFDRPIHPSNFHVPAACLSSEDKKDEPSE